MKIKNFKETNFYKQQLLDCITNKVNVDDFHKIVNLTEDILAETNFSIIVKPDLTKNCYLLLTTKTVGDKQTKKTIKYLINGLIEEEKSNCHDPIEIYMLDKFGKMFKSVMRQSNSKGEIVSKEGCDNTRSAQIILKAFEDKRTLTKIDLTFADSNDKKLKLKKQK